MRSEPFDDTISRLVCRVSRVHRAIAHVEEKLDAQGREPTLKIISETSELGEEIFRQILVMSVAIVGPTVAPMKLLP